MGFWSKIKKQQETDDEDQSVEAGITASEADDDDERYCRTDETVFPVGDNSHLIYIDSDRSTQILPSYLVALLEGCRTFKTLDEHAVACARAFAFSRDGVESAYVETVKDQLAELVEAGLLIPERELLEQCRQVAAREEPPPAIATIGVVTRNRVESLQRCLESFIDNGRAFGRSNDFAVMDDSESAETREQTRAMLSRLKTSGAVSVLYAGAEEKQAFVRALVRDGDLSPEVINFALFDVEKVGYACGVNRNALFLHTAGDMFLSTDDDAVCRLVPPPDTEDDTALGFDDPSPEPMEFWFYPDRETTLRSVDVVDQDILAIHEQMLGKSVASCLAQYGDIAVLNLERQSTPYMRTLLNGAGRVLVTLTGMAGDSGTALPAAFRKLSPGSRERLMESEDVYLSARTSREVLRMVTSPRISRRTWCISTMLSYDNRALLPPFIAGRGTDGVFADTLRVCFEQGYFGDLPWAIQHLPLEPRASTPEKVCRIASGRGLTEIILACVMSKQFWPNIMSGEARLRALGRHLIELGSMRLADFEEFVRVFTWQIQSNYIAEMEAELQRYQEPPQFWAEDVEEYLRITREALARPDYIVPYDLQQGRSLDEARQVSQRLVLRFGELLCAWPDIVARAKELRAQGRRLAVPI